MADIKLVKAKRILHFYDFQFTNNDGTPTNGSQCLLKIMEYAKDLSQTKKPERFIQFGPRTLLVHAISVQDNKNEDFTVRFLFRSLRTTDLPELMNMTDESTREIEKGANEGVVETTHVVIRLKRNTLPLVCIEYNHFGGRIVDLTFLMQVLAQRVGVAQFVEQRVQIDKRIDSIVDKIRKCSKIAVTIRRDKVSVLKQINKGLANAFQATNEETNNVMSSVALHYNTKKGVDNSEPKELISTFVDYLQADPNHLDDFEQLKIHAQYEAMNYRMAEIDLLQNKIKYTVSADKELHGRKLNTLSMYQKMEESFIQLGLRNTKPKL